jgi:hypothetical protein
MTWINDYPEHGCVLAKFSADSMLLNPTEVWLDAPPQPRHNKNKMQLILVWNNQGKQALNESNPAWLNSLKQTIPEATWTCNNSAHVLGTARVKCKNKQRKRFQLLDPDTPIAANIVSASGKRFMTQMSTSTRAHTFPKYKTGNQSHTLMVVPCKMRSANSKL